MNEPNCRERTFTYQVSSLIFCPTHLRWFRYICERLGVTNTLALWESTLADYDSTFLDAILATGWQVVDDRDETPSANLDQFIAEFFPAFPAGLSYAVVLRLIAGTPPTAQIIHAFGHNRISREVTAYQALHLRFDSLALLAEGLIDHHGKQGELIVYDLMTETRLAAVKGNTGSVEAFLDDFASTLEKPTLFSAGLDMEVISRVPIEAVVHVHGCEWARYFQERHPRVGYLMACSTDAVAFRAFNVRLRLQRTQTLMEGAPLCDFRVYALDE